jgi:hypothetical protein
MTSTLQHAPVRAPRTDYVTILMGHRAGKLTQMSKVVNGPCRQKLRLTQRIGELTQVRLH